MEGIPITIPLWSAIFFSRPFFLYPFDFHIKVSNICSTFLPCVLSLFLFLLKSRSFHRGPLIVLAYFENHISIKSECPSNQILNIQLLHVVKLFPMYFFLINLKFVLWMLHRHLKMILCILYEGHLFHSTS